MKLFELSDTDCILTEDALCEMARIMPKDTGLPYIMFASTRDYGTGAHWARIKISNIPGTFSKTDNFVVSVSKDPVVKAGKSKYDQKDLNEIFDWVKLNYEPLIKYWNNEYLSDRDFYDELQKV